MSKYPIVIIDSDAIIAQTDLHDLHHQTALKITKKLEKLNANAIYPSTTIAEAATYMQRVLNSTESAYGTAISLTENSVKVADVGQKTLNEALNYFSPTTSKKNTLFDCIVAAIAQEYKADAIFSFDKFYEKKGFKLASDL